MLIYNDIFSWEGWGGKLRLASGQCRLKIVDLSKDSKQGLSHIRPIIIIVSDIPGSGMSIRSCSSHVATIVAKEFNIDHSRMLFIEYYPSSTYGGKRENVIAERYEAVEFTWHENKAVEPKYRKLTSPLLETVKELNERFL
ncbi:MAG: hypothetical protein MUP22_01470 [Desulfobacterales bacterium]|nr:hypothetical protein [Desulfobacterales bacterium]